MAMSNEQLYMLMRSMLGELDAAINAARELMPEDAPINKYTDILGREVGSEFCAIEPLNELWQQWSDRAELVLVKKTDA